MKLTARQEEILGEAENARTVLGEYFAPMDVGGTNGSYHGAVCRQLVKKGLLDRIRDGEKGFGGRATSLYKITEAGREWLRAREREQAQ